MPSKKKKYNARFPAGRIKKIMQTDEEVGKVAQAVPVIISRTLELFVESLLTKSMQITQARNAKTLTPSHMKQCILSESRFDFLKDLVKNIPDASAQEDNENNAIFEANFENDDGDSLADCQIVESPTGSPKSELPSNTYSEQGTSSSRTPVIQYGPNFTQEKASKNTHKSDGSKLQGLKNVEPDKQLVPAVDNSVQPKTPLSNNDSLPPPLIPITHNFYPPSSGDNLCIDEDYDN